MAKADTKTPPIADHPKQEKPKKAPLKEKPDAQTPKEKTPPPKVPDPVEDAPKAERVEKGAESEEPKQSSEPRPSPPRPVETEASADPVFVTDKPKRERNETPEQADSRRRRDAERKRIRYAEKRAAEGAEVGHRPKPKYKARKAPQPTVETPEEAAGGVGPDGVKVEALVDTEQLAKAGVAMLDILAVGLFSKVLGDEAAAISAQDGAEKQEALEKATTAYMNTADIAMTPAQVLLLTVGMIYLPPAAMLYMQQKGGPDAT